MAEMDEVVRIFDTTLRDGEQAPGASMSVLRKLEIARRLDTLGVDVMEAGFPAASPSDPEAVTQVSRSVRHAHLARCQLVAEVVRGVGANSTPAHARSAAL